MYLSKLVLNESNLAVQRDLSNAHALHQRIMQGFPDENRAMPRADWNVLFRHEPDSNVILVQSTVEPDWSRLASDYLLTYDTKPFNPASSHFQIGKVLRFRLRANPSKRDSQTKKTIGYYKPADQVAWLERQAERNGFRLQVVDVIPSANVFGLKKGNAPVRITTALYQGTLEVTASDLFLTALEKGIGRGKSYGCGLLSVALID